MPLGSPVIEAIRASLPLVLNIEAHPLANPNRYKNSTHTPRTMNGGGNPFYVDAARETIVDPFVRPMSGTTVQNQLLVELRRCEDLVQRDLRYAHLVAGSSKMPMHMIWVARNQDEPVSDTDLAAFKDLAWNEFVKRRYLPGLPGTNSVAESAASMLEIVRSMNLQRRRFQIMGLHEQVEASEIQLILHLCQAEVIRPTDNYRARANQYRRHDRLYEAFALAVGAFVCSSAPFTLGAGTGRYERDLQYEYKKQTTALFVYALRQCGSIVAQDDEDYVARIARLIVVSPDEDAKRTVGFRGDDDKSSDCCCDVKINSLTDTVAEARNNAELAKNEILKGKERLKNLEQRVEQRETQTHSQISVLGENMKEFGKELRDNLDKIEEQLTRMETEFTDKIRIYSEATQGRLTEFDSRLREQSAATRFDAQIRQVQHELQKLGARLDHLSQPDSASSETAAQRDEMSQGPTVDLLTERVTELERRMLQTTNDMRPVVEYLSQAIAGSIGNNFWPLLFEWIKQMDAFKIKVDQTASATNQQTIAAATAVATSIAETALNTVKNEAQDALTRIKNETNTASATIDVSVQAASQSVLQAAEANKQAQAAMQGSQLAVQQAENAARTANESLHQLETRAEAHVGRLTALVQEAAQTAQTAATAANASLQQLLGDSRLLNLEAKVDAFENETKEKLQLHADQINALTDDLGNLHGMMDEAPSLSEDDEGNSDDMISDPAPPPSAPAVAPPLPAGAPPLPAGAPPLPAGTPPPPAGAPPHEESGRAKRPRTADPRGARDSQSDTAALGYEVQSLRADTDRNTQAIQSLTNRIMQLETRGDDRAPDYDARAPVDNASFAAGRP